MWILERWLIPLVLVALAFHWIYRNRLRLRRVGESARLVEPAAAGRFQRRAGEPRWLPIQSAIGSDRPLLPAAQLLRRNGVETRIVRASLLQGRRLLRLMIRQADVARAREIMSKEDLYIKSRLHS